MRFATVHGSAIALVAFLAACRSPESPVSLVEATEVASFSHVSSGPPLIPAWLADPDTLPLGLRGRNNCRFSFGQSTAQWDFHPDGACWERPGPDGWTRQQQHRIHVPHLADCGGGAGDVSPIRVCRAPGEANPCPVNPLTGPTGCALCVRAVACH